MESLFSQHHTDWLYAVCVDTQLFELRQLAVKWTFEQPTRGIASCVTVRRQRMFCIPLTSNIILRYTLDRPGSRHSAFQAA